MLKFVRKAISTFQNEKKPVTNTNDLQKRRQRSLVPQVSVCDTCRTSEDEKPVIVQYCKCCGKKVVISTTVLEHQNDVLIRRRQYRNKRLRETKRATIAHSTAMSTSVKAKRAFVTYRLRHQELQSTAISSSDNADFPGIFANQNASFNTNPSMNERRVSINRNLFKLKKFKASSELTTNKHETIHKNHFKMSTVTPNKIKTSASKGISRKSKRRLQKTLLTFIVELKRTNDVLASTPIKHQPITSTPVKNNRN